MNPRVLVRLYPARWRRRYGDEFDALLEGERWSAHLILDVVAGALRARLDSPLSRPEERVMTSRRIDTVAAFAATLLVLPAVILLASSALRLVQPVQYQPAHAADAVFQWFVSIDAGPLVLFVAPLLALLLGGLAVWRRLSSDPDLRADARLFGDVSVRLLRRPAVVAGALATVASLATLVFVVDHIVAG